LLGKKKKENYGSVLRDCSQAIGINPKSAKAYYRSAMALIAVERFEEALDCCDRCLAFDPHNAGVTSTRQRALDGKDKAERKAREREEREKKEKEEARLLQLALRVRAGVSSSLYPVLAINLIAR
jgi:tetratricopeptide (TPR) repeat protein